VVAAAVVVEPVVEVEEAASVVFEKFVSDDDSFGE
jgi:hypothetical protein